MSRRGRFWFVLLTGLGVAVALFVVAGWLALSAYGPQLAAAQAGQALTEALHRPVQVERVALRLLPPRLDLYSIQVEGDSPGPPFLRLAHARVGLGLSTLWRGRLMLAILLEDGSLNLPPQATGPSPTPLALPDTIPAGRFTLGIQDVRVARMDVRNTDPQRGTDLEIRGLAGTARPGQERLDLDLQADRAGVTSSEVTERVTEIEAAGSLQGDLVRIGRLSAIWLGHRVRARGEVRRIATQPDLALRLEGPVDLSRLVGRYTQTPVQGLAQASLDVRGPLSAPEVSGQARVPALAIGKLQGREVRAEGRWADGRLVLSALDAGLWNGRLHGTLDLIPARLDATRANIQLQDVALEQFGDLIPALPAGLRGRLTLAGQVDGNPARPADLAGRFTLSASRLELPPPLARLGPGRLQASGQLAGRRLELTQAEGRWGGLRVQAVGGLTPDGPRALTVSLEGELADAAGLLGRSDVAGRAVVRAELSGRWRQPEVRGTLEVPALRVLQVALREVRLPFQFANDQLTVSGGSALLGGSGLQGSTTLRLPAGWAPADGIAAVRFRADVRASALRLEDLDPWLPADWRAAGSVALVGRLDGTPTAWQGAGRLSARELRGPRSTPVRELAAAFRLDSTGLDLARLTAELHGIPITARGRYAWAGQGEGEATFGPADLAQIPTLPARPALGGILEGQVHGGVAAGVARVEGDAQLHRLTAAGVALGDGRAEVRLQGRQLEAQVALPGLGLHGAVRGALDPGATLDADVALQQVAVQPLLRAGLQRTDLDLTGTVSGRATLAIPVANPAALRARAALDPVALTIAGDAWGNAGPVVLRWESAALFVDRLLLRSRLGSLEARGSIPETGRLDLTVNGQVPLAVLPAFRPEIREARGLLSVSATLAGTMAAPDIRGEGTIRDGLFQLRSYPDPLREVQASFTASQAGIQVTSATAALGPGRLQATGTLVLRGGALGPYQARLRAQDVPAAPLPGLQTAWNADLEIVGQGDRAQITGRAQLQRGSYTQDLSPLALLGRKEGAAPATAASGVLVKILIAFPNELVVQTGQARLRVGGSLSLEGPLASPVVFGVLEASDGQIEFRGHTFNVVSARARFDDPRRIDPSLDVEATSQIRTYQVTIRLTGRSDNLNVRFSSLPSLPQEDLLTLVTFGVTRDEFTKSAGGIVLGEAAQLVVQDLLGVQPGRSGFDVGMQRSTTGTNVLSVGREVAPRTKLIYKQELSGERQQRFRVEYQLIGPLLLAGEESVRGGYGADLVLRLRFR